MAKSENRPTLLLMCTSCNRLNYSTTKNIKETKEKLELMKFCRYERKKVLHKETKAGGGKAKQ